MDEKPISIEDYAKMIAPMMAKLQDDFNNDFCDGMRKTPEYSHMTNAEIFAKCAGVFPDGIPIDFGFNAPMGGWKDYTP